MDDESPHEQMKRHDDLMDTVFETTRKRERLARDISESIADAIAEAIEVEGANVEFTDQSKDGNQFRLRARLDRAALVAAATSRLPDGFYISHVNDDGSLSVDWTGKARTPAKREHGAILKAIVAEETVTDSDGFIESVPTLEMVVARALELDIAEDDALGRLERLARLDVVDIADDGVYPDTNFSMY